MKKSTLRTLMTSSVNGLEFFLGSIIPVIILSTAVNVLCVFHRTAYTFRIPMGRISYHYDSLHFHCICRRHDLRYLCQNPSIRKYDHYACAHYIYDGSDVVRIQQHLEKISNLLFTGIALNAISAISAGKAPIHLSGIIVLSVEAFLSAALFSDLISKKRI